MDFFPYKLTEILNGVLSVVLVWMLIFLLLHLKITYSSLRKRYGGQGGVIRTLKAMYQNNKPEIALGTIIGFFTIRTFILWFLRFIDNHNIENFILTGGYGSSFLIASTIGLIAGVSCWIRVISPYSGIEAFYVWLSMIASALFFGLGMAYLI